VFSPGWRDNQATEGSLTAILTPIPMPTTLPQAYQCSSLAASSWRIPLLELCLVYAQPPEYLRISLCCLINGVGTD